MIRHRMLSKDISNDTSMSDIRPDDNSFYDVHVQLVALSVPLKKYKLVLHYTCTNF